MMEVRTIKNEILNLTAVKSYELINERLFIRDDGRTQVYTLTEESRISLEEHLKKIK